MIQEQNKLSNNELKKLIYKIQSEGLRVYIKPYKDPYTFEDLKSIIIRTEDGKLVNAENVYTQDKKEIKALTKMYDEIQNERIARKNCFERLEKIVQDELNYQAEMVTWRDGYYVYIGFKKKGDIDTGNDFSKMIANGVNVTFSSSVCGNRGFKKLNKVMDKIREELKNSHIKFYVEDEYDRF